MHEPRLWVRRLGWFLGGAALALMSFTVGRLSVSSSETVPESPSTVAAAKPFLMQNLEIPGDPRELIPLPGPGTQPGFGPGTQPGEGAQPAQCPVYLYQDGRFYQLLPGREGLTPAPGQPGGEGSPELFPLEPVPSIPSPRTPPNPQPPRPSKPPTLADGPTDVLAVAYR